MPSPLIWNAQRTWNFNISFDEPDIYLLRDHVTLMIDLSKDWVSGPPVEQGRFIPITYAIQLELRNYKLSLYLNDHNVIDYPLSDPQNSEFPNQS